MTKSLQRSWITKFRDAFRGVRLAVTGQSSFAVHFIAAALAVAVAAAFQVTVAEWCLLLLCIVLVLVAETFNSALERLAKAVTREENSHIAEALDIGAAAVLLASIGAAVVGVMVIAPYTVNYFR